MIWRRRLLVLAIILSASLAGFVYAFRHLGLWLEVDDPLRHSRALVVMGGGFPYRAAEAARLYNDGWAREVWLTQGSRDDRDLKLEYFGIPVTYEHESGRWLLLKLGVPEQAIRLVPEPVNNTLSELQAVLRYARDGAPGQDDPLVFVTSRSHSRRVRVIWNKIASVPPGIVRSAAMEPYHAEGWWRDTKDALETFREAFGILNAWAGFPIAPRER